MMDPRREALAIQRHFGRYHDTIGEAIIYFRFDADLSRYDRVYDEGFRRYHTGLRIPILWVDQMEAVEDYAPEGRRPTQRIRLAVAARAMYESGISITEVHGNRLEDNSPSTIWREDRMHDIIWYDSRFYEVSGFQIRGRVQGEDVIIGVTGIESFDADDMNLDFPPGSVIPTPAPPTPAPFSVFAVAGPTPGLFSFGVVDDPTHRRVTYDFGDGGVGMAPASQTIDHQYEAGGTYDVVAHCHREDTSCTVDVVLDGYGYGKFGTGPYGDPNV